MKTPLYICCGLMAVCGLVNRSEAQTLYYNSGSNPVWVAADAWSTSPTGATGYSSWVSGGTANFVNPYPSSSGTIALSGNVSVGALINSSTTAITFSKGSGSTDVMTFSGGQISGNFTFAGRTDLKGSFEVVSGAVDLTTGGGAITAITGTATVSGGSLSILQSERTATTSNFVVSGGDLIFQDNTNEVTDAVGNMTINSGNLLIGRVSGSPYANVSFTSLQGTGGNLVVRSNNTAATSFVTIDQSANTVYAGAITGTNGNATLSFTKSGTGSLTLSGTISGMQRTTTVNAGTLIINSADTSFGDDVGTIAISVQSGATLSGTGTISTLAGDDVVLVDGARLGAGLEGSAGRTTYDLGAGAELDLSATTTQTGWLAFDLGADTAAGLTFDQISLTGGSLNIGTGLLNFDDFSFTALAGFGVGEYALFSTTGIVGTLGSSLSGTINGFDSSLSQAGNTILLTVVPEPSPLSAALLGGVFVVGLLRIVRGRSRPGM